MTGPYRLAAVMLAAGLSSRMDGSNKLLMPFRGEPLIRHAVRAAEAAGLAQIAVVTGRDAESVGQALSGCEVQTVHNPVYATGGMASSIRAGIGVLSPDVDAAFIALGDMPFITAAHYEGLAQAFAAGAGRVLCVPVHKGRRGHPVLFPRATFAKLLLLQGDSGAGVLLRRHAARVVEVPVSSPAVLVDFDTIEDFAEMTAESVAPDI